MKNDNPAMRVQVALYGVLQAEVVVEFEDARNLFEKFSMAKWRAGLECGGAVIQRADKPRTWNVPVGSKIGEVMSR